MARADVSAAAADPCAGPRPATAGRRRFGACLGAAADGRERVRSAASRAGTVVMRRALFLLVLLGVSPPAAASPCNAIRDTDKRIACLAEERRQPAGCTSIKDWDAREACRQRATR